MTIEEIKKADFDALEARSAEILGINKDETSAEELEQRAEEAKAIEERKAELARLARENAEERQQVAGDESLEIKKNFSEEERTMTPITEYRNNAEYINAFAEYIKHPEQNETELRSLLTTNVGEGTIAVPDFVLDEIKTAWEKEEIMSLVPKTSIKGNLKVQFEISGTDAVIHTEGQGAISEEELVEGIITIVPAFIKKWISISDEVMSMRGEAFLRYIYAELTHKIAKKAADQLIALIVALPTTATATSVSANKISEVPSMATVATAIGNLSDVASNPVIIMNKLTWAEFKRVQYANGYGVDPFEGLAVKFNNTLPAYSAASANAVYMIVGDLGEGALANMPNGEGVDFKFDELTRKKEDLVEVLGKQYVGLGLVADKAFVNVTKPATAG